MTGHACQAQRSRICMMCIACCKCLPSGLSPPGRTQVVCSFLMMVRSMCCLASRSNRSPVPPWSCRYTKKCSATSADSRALQSQVPLMASLLSYTVSDTSDGKFERPFGMLYKTI